MKYKCIMFGHKWQFNLAIDIRPYCKRCGEEDYYLDNLYKRQAHDIKMEQMQKEADEQYERVKKRLGGEMTKTKLQIMRKKKG